MVSLLKITLDFFGNSFKNSKLSIPSIFFRVIDLSLGKFLTILLILDTFAVFTYNLVNSGATKVEKSIELFSSGLILSCSIVISFKFGGNFAKSL